MSNTAAEIIENKYEKKIINAKIIADHGFSQVYLIETPAEKFALKVVGETNPDFYENEHELVYFLMSNGISVPKIFPAADGNFFVRVNGSAYVLYEYIEGTTFGLNSAPDWFLTEQARLTGKIQTALKHYGDTSHDKSFGQDSFSSEGFERAKKNIAAKINGAEEKNDKLLAAALRERSRHIETVSGFRFDCGRLTYVPSHGDLYINHFLLARRGDLVVIDWARPKHWPACFEIFMSYVYAAPECKSGEIDAKKFAPVLREFLNFTELNLYDLQTMPFFLYFYCVFCSFTPPYDNLPEDYKKIAALTDNLANWLQVNAETLSGELAGL
ncbi:MAG: phosphotransferase [Defluviitaleaceae bacterium]|nr:phosphotransferase [Defluviitaleaceae bacterium]